MQDWGLLRALGRERDPKESVHGKVWCGVVSDFNQCDWPWRFDFYFHFQKVGEEVFQGWDFARLANRTVHVSIFVQALFLCPPSGNCLPKLKE